MTANTAARETGQGRPDGLHLATLAERHPLCECTWIYHAASKYRLKYMNTACLATAWHLGLVAHGGKPA